MEIVNLTPHPVKLIRNGVQVEYPSVGLARVKEEYETVGEVDGVEDCKVRYGEIVGLPESREGVIYVVSGQLKNAAIEKGRYDTRSPGKFIRDEAGRILYAQCLLR